MIWEAVVAGLVGLAAVWLVLQPLLHPARPAAPVFEPLDPEETPKGIALAALKEIEFDRETGKLSDADYEMLKSKYTAAALDALRLDALRAEAAPVPDDLEVMIAARARALRSAAAPTSPDAPGCSICGPRPEADALFCSTCGRRLPKAGACGRCGAPLGPDSRFCEQCGNQVAA
ncbi:MAG: zinc ribbon domain-containing protein [Gemmatimonadales bacterium]